LSDQEDVGRQQGSLPATSKEQHMSRILILGAHGQIARLVTERLLEETTTS
jgi:hypothetical protein